MESIPSMESMESMETVSSPKSDHHMELAHDRSIDQTAGNNVDHQDDVMM
jgi:hypothetical protein